MSTKSQQKTFASNDKDKLTTEIGTTSYLGFNRHILSKSAVFLESNGGMFAFKTGIVKL